jgi:hypothetical protein
MYLAGYAVEIALKAAICKHNHWPDFPFTNAEFNANPQFAGYKNHNLNTLLVGTGVTIPAGLTAQSLLVSSWRPESRYAYPAPLENWTTHKTS